MTLNHKTKESAWKEWNQKSHIQKFTPEQVIEWLEGMRAFLFEVWKNNPEKLRQWNEESIKSRNAFASQDQI